MTYGIICEELARIDWVVASVVSVTNSLLAGSILRFGSEDQKRRWLPAMADGSCLTSACLTEPDGGTDLANLRTLAVKVDGGWRLTGTKVFISHAAHAGLFLVVATVDREKKHRGVTAFLVDPRTEGIRIGDFPMRTLRRDNLAEVHFENAFVPDEGLLGEPGRGFPVLGSALDTGRFSVAARCVGQAQRCIDLAVPYALDREAFGQKIAEFQMIQKRIADMTCRRADEGSRRAPRLHGGVDGEAHGQPGRRAQRPRRHPDPRWLRSLGGVRGRAPAAGGQGAGVWRGDQRAPQQDHR
jgi:alkylation response protein AidB-like acyl-CoA dehydrogenase